MPKKITIWSKYCVSCLWYDQWLNITNYAQKYDIKLKIKRTVYRPDWHWRATKLYGNPEYSVFVVVDGKVKDFMKFADSCKNKLVKSGKMKEGRDDMHSLQRAGRTDREDCADY